MPLKKQVPFDENGPTTALPPPVPTSERGHSRSRTATDLPPLFSRSPSSSPTRLSNFIPSLRSSRNPSPERVSPSDAAEYEVGDELQKQRNSGGVAKGLAAWFEGSSDPVNIGIVPSPGKEKQEFVESSGDQAETMFNNSSENVDTFTQRPSRPQSQSRQSGGPRFSFFRKQSTLNLEATTDLDELGSLDIREALFPHGPVDEYSPAAFKNLQLNAEGTLRKFQNAHIEQQKQVRSLTARTTSQADDLEASQIRSEHLKMQLEEMAERGAEQERLILALRNELDAICQPGFEPHSSVRKVPHNLDMSATYETARSKRNRVSDISAGSEQSDQFSIFSADQRSLNNFVDSPGTSVAASPVIRHANMHVTKISPAQHQHEHAAVSIIPVAECQKCHGINGNEAWDVIAMMKAEKQALTERIEELEGANDQALDLLGGLKLGDLGLK